MQWSNSPDPTGRVHSMNSRLKQGIVSWYKVIHSSRRRGSRGDDASTFISRGSVSDRKRISRRVEHNNHPDCYHSDDSLMTLRVLIRQLQLPPRIPQLPHLQQPPRQIPSSQPPSRHSVNLSSPRSTVIPTCQLALPPSCRPSNLSNLLPPSTRTPLRVPLPSLKPSLLSVPRHHATTVESEDG